MNISQIIIDIIREFVAFTLNRIHKSLFYFIKKHNTNA